jgi:hypothetical protein
MEETMTKEEKRELEAILDHHIIYSKKTHEYTLLKPHQDLSKALTKFINRVQQEEETNGGDND